MQSRTDCGPSENTTAEEREAISVRLTQILTAYAYSDPAVGYCQGKLRFSIISTPALLQCRPTQRLAISTNEKTLVSHVTQEYNS